MLVEEVHWRIPEDFTGKTVLDIGCADGARSILAWRRGAKFVQSIDEK
jgi:predicted nicotinamide N-methyase